MAEQKQPQGVVAVMIDSDGYVMGHAADFDRQHPGGFKLEEAQASRARRALARNVVNAYVSDRISGAIEDHECDRIMERLQKGGAKVSIFEIGYEN